MVKIGPGGAQIINEMAVQTAMLNQDRCTKNYYVMQDPTTSLCDACQTPV